MGDGSRLWEGLGRGWHAYNGIGLGLQQGLTWAIVIAGPGMNWSFGLG